MVLTERWPVLGRPEQAAVWRQIWTVLGRVPRTIDAYAHRLAEYPVMCEREDVDRPTPRELDIPATARLLPLVDVRQGGTGPAPR